VDDCDAVGDRADLRVVGHDDEGAVLPPGEVAKQLEDLLPDLRVEVRGRLVGEEERGRAGEGARDRDALLLPARKVARQERLPVGEADGVEDALGFLPGGRALHAADVQGVLDVLDGGEAGKRLNCWKTKPIERAGWRGAPPAG